MDRNKEMLLELCYLLVALAVLLGIALHTARDIFLVLLVFCVCCAFNEFRRLIKNLED